MPRDKEKQRESNRKWRKKNPEKVRESDRKWRKKNPEKAREYSRKWAEKNPEKVKETVRKWIEKNPEKVKECKSLIKCFKTSKVLPHIKKLFALKRAIKNNILTPELYNRIAEGETHAAYVQRDV